MQNKAFITTAIAILMLNTTPANAGSEQLIKKCQGYKNKIEKYTQLKRKGGSASAMSRYHNERNKYKDLFSEANCKKVRSKLK